MVDQGTSLQDLVQAYRPAEHGPEEKLEKLAPPVDGKDGRIIQVPLDHLKASKARFMLEVWLMPRESKRIQIRAVTILWVNGEAMGPGGDLIILECPSPSCREIFVPPIPWYLPKRVPEGQQAEPRVFCLGCQKSYSRHTLVDSRGVAGTWDVLGAHVAMRFNQLGGDADIMKRIIHENMHRPVPGILERERGSVDRYLRAQNRRDFAYFFLDSIMGELGRGVDPVRLFTNFLKA